jgi:hypothetical protein
LLLGALAGSTLLPFVQAIASKAGEDVYTKIRDKLSRRHRKQTKSELRTAGTVTIADPDVQVVLQLPASMTAAMAARLGDVRVPPVRDGWLLVRWDHGRAEWVAGPCDPPAGDSVVQVASDD